ncbi:MAG: hypothetical protein RIR26_1367 [Pseudomonadota bacterium]|jgi:sec-independent protein translocase protein TatA
MFGIGGGEILLIALVAVVLFGTDDLPKNMKKFVKVWRDFRGVTNDLQRGWLDVRDQVTRDILMDDTKSHDAHTADLNTSQSKASGVSDPSADVLNAGEVSASDSEGMATTEDPNQDSSSEPYIPVPRSAAGSMPREMTPCETAEGEPSPIIPSADPDKST